MKFTFKNLGTIKQTTLDLRPLTVIIGPNNTNKTYLAYCVHGLADTFSHGAAGVPLDPHGTESTFALAAVIASVRAAAKAASARFTKQLAEYFQDTRGGLFKGTDLIASIVDEDVLAGLQMLAKLHHQLVKVVDRRVLVRSFSGVKKGPLLQSLGEEVLGCLANLPLTLPAERNALVIAYKVLGVRRYRILRDRERRLPFLPLDNRTREPTHPPEQGDIRYPTPIEEFLDFLTDVELEAKNVRNNSQTPFGRLALRIEDAIQTGHRTEYAATKLGGNELALTVSDTLRLDLYNASSSIKQLAPLLLYLRYRAAPNQLLIIDEPEMNLHPEGQAKLLEALAMLANLGVHVLVTTHSPYIMAHLNNLTAADPKSRLRRTRQAQHLYMGDPAAFLAPDHVSAYEMRTDGLASLADPEYGIRWDTLSDVSSELQRRYFAIVEEPQRAKKK